MGYSKHLWLCFLILASSIHRVDAATTTIAVTGDSATGVAGGLFENLVPGALNSSGKVVFSADLQHGPGGVAAGDANGVWSYDQGTLSLVARQGSGSVPGLAGANFDLFRSISVVDNGDIYLRGSLENGVGGIDSSNDEGLWKYAGTNSLELRIGDSPVPGVSGAMFEFLPFFVQVSRNGQYVINGSMEDDVEIGSGNDGGVWTYDSIGGTLVAREGTGFAPGLTSEFNNFVSPRVNDDQQIAFRASLKHDVFISDTNSIGIWKYSPLGGEKIAQEGSLDVPDIVGASFTGLTDPLMNGNDQVAFVSNLVNGGAINSTNDEGVWLYTETSGELLARTGSGGVPGIAGADFLSLDSLLLSDTGDVLVQGELVTGVGGVTSSNNRGLWGRVSMCSMSMPSTPQDRLL